METRKNQKKLEQLFKGKWKLKIIHWNSGLSNFLYFPLQFIWRTLQKLAKAIINKLIQIEFIRTKKNPAYSGHIIMIANKQ